MKTKKTKNKKLKTFTMTQVIYVIFDVEAENENDAVDKAYSVINDHSVDAKLEPAYNLALTQAEFDVEVSYLNEENNK